MIDLTLMKAYVKRSVAGLMSRAIDPMLDAAPRQREVVIGQRRDHTGRVLLRVFDLRWRKPHEDRARSGKPWRHNDTTSLAKRTRRQAGAAP